MSVPIFQVDAFTKNPFTGNPAAVCLLDDDADPEWMQAVAAEMNLSNTGFFRPVGNAYELRWFTPRQEVDLCGHATLASAHVLWTEGLVDTQESILFHTHSGVLTCTRADGLIELDFPATPAEMVEPVDGLLDALGLKQAGYIGKSKFDLLVVADSEESVRSLKPDLARLAHVPTRGVIVTAVSEDPEYDFVSRFFAPAIGVNEDPVTGSAHCCLGPFWKEQLGKSDLMAYQASQRGGAVRVRVDGDRVLLGGHAVTVFQGKLC